MKSTDSITVTILPLTSRKPGRRVYPNEVLIPADLAGLAAESLVLAHQIRTLSKERIQTPLGYVDEDRLREVIRQALLYHLDLALS